MSSAWKLYWGDSHTNLHVVPPGAEPAASAAGGRTAAATNLPREVSADLDAALAHARDTLDFWPIAYYPYTYSFTGDWRTEHWRPAAEVDAAWRSICEMARRGNHDGELVVFPGFEWQGDGRQGDHNVFFRDDDPPLLRSATLEDLYADLRASGRAALVLPHHTAYQPGVRSKDWSVHDEDLSPLAEIFSAHGCSESDAEWPGLRRNWHMGPGVSGGSYEDALARGIKIGAIASTDEHAGNPGRWGCGLMGCWATALDRRSLWEAFTARRAYAVTGDRIELDVRVAGAMMGAAITQRGPVRVRVRVRGLDAIDRIELIRKGRVIATHCCSGTWAPPGGPGRDRARLRVEAGWGPTLSDRDDVPLREWTCRIEVPNGAIVSAQPCWRTRGQHLGPIEGARCDFGFRTQCAEVPGRGPQTEATVFEVEAAPGDEIRLDLDGRKVSMTLAEAMAGSRVVYFPEETAQFARECGVDLGRQTRKEGVYFYSHKVKVHRAIPEAGLTAELDYTDAAPPAGVNHYRVRVMQDNGQVAWSSPVWVDAG